MPARDCMPVQVLTALEFGGEDKREKSSRLLHHILLASQKLIRPYVTEVLHVHIYLYLYMFAAAAPHSPR